MSLLDDLLSSAIQGGITGRGAEPSAAGRSAGAGAGGNNVLLALLPIVLAMLANRGGAQTQSGGGGLGDLLGQVLGGGSSRGGGLGDVLGQVLGGGSGGGLGDLLGRVEQAGYGDQARSWVGTGRNLSLPPDAIGQIFGPGGLAAIARQAGLSESEASAGLAQLLPELVDRVKPQGQVPEPDRLAERLGELVGRLGR